MSISGRDSTAALLVRPGFVVVLALVNVSGFRPVLARGWHGQTSSVSGISVNAHGFVSAELLGLVRARPLTSVAADRDCYSIGYSGSWAPSSHCWACGA
jgi:hypothetical protein